MATVYFTKEISPESLVRIYDALGVTLPGKVAVKISTGEPGGHNFLQPKLIQPLVSKLQGTIVECCTAYGGKRQDPKDHWQAIRDHGFLDIAPVDLMDEEGEISIPVTGGFHLIRDIVGAHLDRYDSVLILSHFKGHIMGGFGGALKNIAIGIASSAGKALIHSAGATTDTSRCWKEDRPKQDDFLESMADACQAVQAHVGRERMLYVSVANRLSVDCDCDSHPAEPKMGDLGIFASTDPVALDQACYDAVINADDPGKADLIERMNSRHGIHTVEAAEQLGVGSRAYTLVTL